MCLQTWFTLEITVMVLISLFSPGVSIPCTICIQAFPLFSSKLYDMIGPY